MIRDSMADVKQSRWIQRWVKGHLMLGIGTSEINSQDQLKKDYYDSNSSHTSKLHCSSYESTKSEFYWDWSLA